MAGARARAPGIHLAFRAAGGSGPRYGGRSPHSFSARGPRGRIVLRVDTAPVSAPLGIEHPDGTSAPACSLQRVHVAPVLLDRAQEGGRAGGRLRHRTKPRLASPRSAIVDRAVEESRRRDHALLANEHIFLAFAQVEWDMFAQVMRDLELEPARDPAGARGAPERGAGLRRPRPARGAGRRSCVFKLALPPREPRRAAGDRGGGPVLGDLRGEPGRAGLDHPAARRRARAARLADRRRGCATSSCATSGCASGSSCRRS